MRYLHYWFMSIVSKIEANLPAYEGSHPDSFGFYLRTPSDSGSISCPSHSIVQNSREMSRLQSWDLLVSRILDGPAVPTLTYYKQWKD